MYYQFDDINGERVTIDCSEDGSVVYTVGNKKTKFKISESSNYLFKFSDGTISKLACGEYGVSLIDIIIQHGEDRLAKNNDDRERDGQWRFEALDNIDEHVADLYTSNEAIAIRNIEVEKLHTALSFLKSIDQKIAYMHWIEGYKQVEIALILGMSRNAIQIRCSKLLKKLHKLLNQ